MWVLFQQVRPFRAKKAWRIKRQHLRQPCQKPLGFILAWPRKILWERTRGPRALWSAVNQLQPETAKCCSDSAAPYGAVWEGITSLIPCLQSQKWLKLHEQQGLPGRVTMSTGEGFLPLTGVSSPPSCCCSRFWTVYSLWGNMNSLATSKYLNSFKTTGIQQRKGKYPRGASVN